MLQMKENIGKKMIYDETGLKNIRKHLNDAII